MPPINISTGPTFFTLGDEEVSSPVKDADRSKVFKVLMLADFGGHNSGLGQRLIPVDKDNFEAVFRKLGVSIQLPIEDEPVRLAEIEDFHPEALMENMSVFAKYAYLKRSLKTSGGIEKVAAFLGLSDDDRQAEAASPAASSNLFDSVLESSTSTSQSADVSIQGLINEIVAPYRIEKPSEQQRVYESALDDLIQQSLRACLQTPAFRVREAAWRCADFLNRRLDTDRTIELFLLDSSKEALVADLEKCENSHTEFPFYQCLKTHTEIPGEKGFDLLLTDFMIEATQADLKLLSVLGCTAAELGSTLLLNGAASLIGLQQYADVDADARTEMPEPESVLWQTLRAQGFAKNVYLVAPKFLHRMPYGKKTSPVEGVRFEEVLGKINDSPWASGSVLLGFLMAREFELTGHRSVLGKLRTVEDLPIFQFEDGELPLCVEKVLNDSEAESIESVGITTLRGIKNQNAVMIQKLVPLYSGAV